MYDFETLVDRRGTTSSKWHMIETDMGPGNEDVIALSRGRYGVQARPRDRGGAGPRRPA